MKKYLLSIFLLFLSSFVYAASVPIEGYYDCKRTELDGKTSNNCKMSIQKTGNTYSMRSACDDGNAYFGTGIYNKAKNNFAFVFINPKQSEETGVVGLNIKEDGTMIAQWTYLNKRTLGHAHCTRHVKFSKMD